MNINQLEYLVASARLGSYAAAARAYYVTPQAIVKAVKLLEKELGIEIIKPSKKSKGLMISDSGRKIIEQSEKVIEEVERLKRFAAETKEKTFTSKLRCAIPTWGIRGDLFDSALREYSDNKIGSLISFWSSEACVSGLKAGLVDAAVTLGGMHSIEYEDRYLFSFTPKIVVGGNNPFSQKSQIGFSDMEKMEIATPLDIRSGYSWIFARSEGVCAELKFINIDHDVESFRAFFSTNKQAAVLVVDPSKLLEAIPDSVALPLSDEEDISFPIYLSCAKGKGCEMDELVSLFSSVARSLG